MGVGQSQQIPNQDVAASIIAFVWEKLANLVTIHNIDDPRERGKDSTAFIQHCYRRGLFKHCFNDFDVPGAALDVMAFVSWGARDEMIPALVDTGVHRKILNNIVKKGENFDFSVTTIRSLTTVESTRPILRRDGAVEAVLPLLEYLNAEMR